MMNLPEIHIIYSSFGSAFFYRQTLLSVYSFFYSVKDEKNLDKIHVHIYTDNESYLRRWLSPFKINYITLDEKKLTEYKENTDLIHMIKINIIQSVTEKYRGNIIYVDSDTLFINNPLKLFETIAPAISLLENKEYDFAYLVNAKDSLHNKGYYLFRDQLFFLPAVGEFKIPLGTYSYCAGLVGISSANKLWLEDVKNITKQVYTKLPIFTAEQWAFSFIIQSRSKVDTTNEVLFHYWRKEQKQFFESEIKMLMARNIFFKRKRNVFKEIEKYKNKILNKESLLIEKRTLFMKISNRLLNFYDSRVLKKYWTL